MSLKNAIYLILFSSGVLNILQPHVVIPTGDEKDMLVLLQKRMIVVSSDASVTLMLQQWILFS